MDFNRLPTIDASKTLAEFAASLTFEQIPQRVVERAQDLLVDWFGSCLAGKGARPVEAIRSVLQAMAPGDGDSEILISRQRSSPLFAAAINAAASHFSEQDDVHNGSVFHPATVVFSPAIAVAQALGSSGKDLLTAAVAGYEIGIRVGEYLGRSHYRIFHTTATVGPIAAAVAVGSLLKLNAEQMLNAIGSAGTQAGGLWEFLRDAADSKQLHTAHAAATGLTSAYLAAQGFTGARHILEGAQGMAAGMSQNSDLSKLTGGLSRRWTTAETSFKFHAACRHTHPAADALLLLLERNALQASDIASVTARVHQGAIDVLGPVTDPKTVHQAKFSMGTVLGLIAVCRRAGMTEFEQHYRDLAVVDFRQRVQMQLDPEVDAAYPARWIGKVEVETKDGRHLQARVDEPKGDPGNTLTRVELETKAITLARLSNGANEGEVRTVLTQFWNLPALERLPATLLPPTSA